ncbi:putative oxidoreductase [Periconia macrospinosa]|uniref:Putative oxidoreductase n=1 Tax=Periconia macrospinosa TaxID=97972 RepID=A0A2V1D7A5_9PLEO|nr:putative oxidoreductase [Periconia macrospinosa]
MGSNVHWFTQGTAFVTPVHDTYPFISSYSHETLAGISALITGSSRGIGLQTAVHFAKAGCSKIAIAARSSLSDARLAVEKAAAEYGTTINILTLDLDVSSTEQTDAAAAEVKRAFGHLDILINNAGHLSEFQSIGESDPYAWWKSWETNIHGTYLCIRSFLPLLLDSARPTVINVSSAGAQVINPGASAYQGSKFALCRLTEFLDAEYGKRGLVAIALNPGGVVTSLALGMPEHMMTLLKDTVELSADTMVWLCMERREWLSGRFVTATWNMEELAKRREEIVGKDLLKFRMAFE